MKHCRLCDKKISSKSFISSIGVCKKCSDISNWWVSIGAAGDNYWYCYTPYYTVSKDEYAGKHYHYEQNNIDLHDGNEDQMDW